MTRSFPTVNATAVTVALSPTASASGMGALLTSRARLPSREAGASLRDRTPAPPALIPSESYAVAPSVSSEASTMGRRYVRVRS